MTPVMRGAMRCGENSLPIYCLGVLLALASHVALLDISNGLPMQIALSLGGILMMIVAAMLLNSIRIKPKRQPTHDDALAHGDFRLVRNLNF
jgi:integral membrane sensor domain MASE1